jgi:hypothetical protein
MIKPTSTSQAYRLEVEYQPWVPLLFGFWSPRSSRRRGCIFIPTMGRSASTTGVSSPGKRIGIWRIRLSRGREWFVYYEIYLLTGKWLGKSALHGAATKVAEPAATSENVQERAE